MNFQEIAKSYEKGKRKMMTDAVIKNKNHTRNLTTYHAESLTLMCGEWDLLFPQHKQDMKCISCRAAVNKFWSTMVDEWIEIEQTPKKRNVSKKTKAK